MTTHSTAVDHPSRRLVVGLPQAYDEVRARDESLVPEVDFARFSELTSWQATLELAGINAPHGFMRYYRGATLGSITREHGSIIFNSSGAPDRGRAGTGVYAATKAAVRTLARTWADELGSRGIRVNTVNPAATETPGLMALYDADPSVNDDEFKTERSQGIPLGRLATTDEVANTVLFLASGLSSFTTGAALPVDGGYNQI